VPVGLTGLPSVVNLLTIREFPMISFIVLSVFFPLKHCHPGSVFSLSSLKVKFIKNRGHCGEKFFNVTEAPPATRSMMGVYVVFT
jgi:hypothetical protein